MHSLATNADQRIDMSVDHVGAIDNGNGRGSEAPHVVNHVNPVGRGGVVSNVEDVADAELAP